MSQLRACVTLMLVCYFAGSIVVQALDDADLLTADKINVASISSKRYEIKSLDKREQCIKIWELLYDMVHPPVGVSGFDALPAELRRSRGPVKVKLLHKAAELLNTRRSARRALTDFISDCAKELADLDSTLDESFKEVDQPEDEQMTDSTLVQKLREANEALKRQVADLTSKFESEAAKVGELTKSLFDEKAKLNECESHQLKSELERQQAVREGKSKSNEELSARLQECESRSDDQASRLNKLKLSRSKLEEQLQESMAKLDKCLTDRLAVCPTAPPSSKVSDQAHVEVQKKLNDCEARYLTANSKASRARECESELAIKSQELERAVYRANDLVARLKKLEEDE